MEQTRHSPQHFVISCQAGVSAHHLLITFTRWLAVYRPVHVHTGSLLKLRHMVVASLVVLVWCLAISAVFMNFNLLSEPTHQWVYGWIAVHIVGLAVPVLPLIVFNVLLLIKIRTPFSPTSTKSEQHQSSTWGSTQRLTVAILSMSAFSVVAYTIGETTTVVHWLGHWSDGGDLFLTLQSSFELLQVVNSSINVVFYFAFSRNFRSSSTKCFSRWVLRGRAVSAGHRGPHSEDKGDSSSSRTATETVAL
ncbi:uncharacterized protein LOC112563101 [Pomacea canaliculata]|uniref:uncharacterized protein LOC112563101 n=1 Tax=Pomacea canaliculata TaxID=400727 RepID=UPI000D73C00D|nr:uncharacterized protein LOC112563101 [Pomacea canaliculata]XP_025092624.1 uncharacterized protein LOC112563101 [Pomacea canaliculata]